MMLMKSWLIDEEDVPPADIVKMDDEEPVKELDPFDKKTQRKPLLLSSRRQYLKRKL